MKLPSKAILAALGAALASAPAAFGARSVAPESKADVPVVLLAWTDSEGNRIDPPIQARSHWVWDAKDLEEEERPPTAGGRKPARAPFLRVWLKFPPKHSIQSVPKSDNYYRISPGKSFHGGYPDLVEGQPGEYLSIDMTRREGTFRIRLRDPKDKLQAWDLKISAPMKEAALRVSSVCSDNRIFVVPRRAKGTHLYLAAECRREDEENVDVRVLVPEHAFSKGNVLGEKLEEGPGEATFRIRPHDWTDRRFEPFGQRITSVTDRPTDIVGLLFIGESEQEKLSSYEIHMLRPEGPAPLELSGSFVPGFVSYSENSGADFGQASLAARFGATWEAGRRSPELGLDAGANTFVATGGTGHIWSAAAKAGFHLPFSSRFFRMKFHLGWMAWGVVAPNDAFGIGFLHGPHTALELDFDSPRSRRFRVHGKFSLLAPNPGRLRVSDHELGGGLSYRLNDPETGRERAWNLIIEASRVHGTSDRVTRVTSFGLGLAYSVQL